MTTMAATLSTLLSPIMGGQLADLAGQYPDKFGNNSFLKKYPYETPALVNASMLLITFLAIFFFLEEVCPRSNCADVCMYFPDVLIVSHVPRHMW